MSELRQQAERYVREKIMRMPAFGEFVNELSVALIGSVAAGLDDEHSDIDLLAVLPDEHFERVAILLKPVSHERSLPSIVDFSRPEIATKVRSVSWMRMELARDFIVMTYILDTMQILADPTFALEKLVAEVRRSFRETTSQLLLSELAGFRNALYWIEQHERRGADFAVPAVLTRAEYLQRALHLSFLVDERAYPYRKWLWRLLPSTSAGARIAEQALRFVPELSVNASGATLPARRFYKQVIDVLNECKPTARISELFAYDSTYYYSLLR